MSRQPVSEALLVEDLQALGIQAGSTLMVHSSLSALGWVIGGPGTLVRALLETLGPNGTLVMPAATPLGADPATWHAPPPKEWWEEIRAHLPVFDPQTSPTTLGAVPETFRGWPGTRRSDHPLESVCARGPKAAEITARHPLAFSEGPEGPFGRLHDLKSSILLLGVGFNRCTALHFAETLSPKRRTTTVRFPVLEQGRRGWREVPNVADDNDTHFPLIGEGFLATGKALSGRIGLAKALLFAMEDLVDFALDYFDREF